jgi:trehalose 6-phosphate synthase/phosphatase
MSDIERHTRQAALYEVVRTHTSHTWAAILVTMLLSLVGTQNKARRTPVLDQEELCAKYKSAKRRLLMFDYDVSVFAVSFMASLGLSGTGG